MQDVLIVIDRSDPIPPFYLDHFCILILRWKADGDLLLSDGDKKKLTLGRRNVIAVIVPKDSSVESLTFEAAKEWLLRQNFMAPLLFESDSVNYLLDAFVQQRDRAKSGVRALRAQISELRIESKMLEYNVDTLRALVRDQGLSIPRLGFSNPPDPVNKSLPPNTKVVRQSLPIDISTFCGFAIYLPFEFLTSPLSIELSASDDDCLSANWSLSATPLAAGWNCFIFSVPRLMQPGNATLSFRSCMGMPPFSLGRETLLPARSASFDGVLSDRALALRAFVNARGIDGGVTQEMLPVISLDQKPVTRVDLRLDGKLSLIDIRSLNEQATFPVVAALVERQHILVHPLCEVPTIALISDICPPGTREVVAWVATLHPDASPVEYAIHVCKITEIGQGDAELIELASNIDWTIVRPYESAELRIELPEVLEQSSDLMLLTRLSPGTLSYFCWAHFTRISFVGRFEAM